MKKLTLPVIFTIGSAIACLAQEPLYDLTIFTNSRMEKNYFPSLVEVTAPSSITTIQSKLPVSTTVFHTPGNSLQLEYVNGKGGKWKTGIVRADLRGQDHFKKTGLFSFYVFVRSSKTLAGALPLFQFQLGNDRQSKSYSFKVPSAGKWTHVIVPIDLAHDSIDNMRNIAGVYFYQGAEDGGKHEIYVDDIGFLPEDYARPVTATPMITGSKGYAMHVNISWKAITDKMVQYVKVYRSENGTPYRPIGIQSRWENRYTDFTGETGKNYSYKIALVNYNDKETALSGPASAQTRSMSDDELMTMVQEACFRYYWEGAEASSGLAREDLPGRRNMIAMGASGFGIMALIAGTERKFITRAQSVERFLQITSFLMRAETFHGAFSHFVDGPSGKVEPFFGKRDNGGDLVETSFLLQGLIAARAYFNANDANEKLIRDRITAIWERVEWDWYRRYPDSKFLYWHWSPDKEWIINHRLIGWNETMVTYLLAIASPTHGVPAQLYYSGWANQDSTGQKYRSAWGGTKDGSMYTNGKEYYGIKLDVGVSNGGPLFFTHYSYLGYNPHALTDKYTNYFTNNQHIAQINHAYCVDNPNKYLGYGDSCWGLTASDGPFDYSADEPIPARDKGKIGPTGAIGAFPYTPVESMKALKNYYFNQGKFLWGEYGFRDAFNLSENWCSEIYMGLNQAPMVIMIENYRSGLLWKLFMSDKDVQAGLKKLSAVQPE
jgi:exo beta-1,2-glucooligosaccharide sophorohydrolase (non-reducing end)